MKRNLTKFFVLLTVILVGCTPKEEEKAIEWNSEKSTTMNKQFSIEEEVDINVFLSRKQDWKMTKTGSGLRYYVYEEGVNTPPLPDDYVDIEYSIELLDGTKCYITPKDEVEELKVDKAQVESGIQEALKLLNEGSRAKLIIPSHLAHGLVGDMEKIPPLSTLLVDMHIVKIYRTKR